MSGPDPARSRDWGEAELDLALQADECPACTLATQTEDAILSWLARANIRDHDTVKDIVRARGLCGRHWVDLLERSPTPLGLSLIKVLRMTTEAVAEDLNRGVGPFPPNCPICASMARRVRSTVAMALERLQWPDTRSALEASFGLCQPHLADAFHVRPKPETARILLSMHRAQLGRLIERLAEADADQGPRAHIARLVQRKLGGSVATTSLERPEP
jgi:hypothetical protein